MSATNTTIRNIVLDYSSPLTSIIIGKVVIKMINKLIMFELACQSMKKSFSFEFFNPFANVWPHTSKQHTFACWERAICVHAAAETAAAWTRPWIVSAWIQWAGRRAAAPFGFCVLASGYKKKQPNFVVNNRNWISILHSLTAPSFIIAQRSSWQEQQ